MLDVLLPCLLLLILEESVADARGTTSLSCYLSFSFMTCIKKIFLETFIELNNLRHQQDEEGMISAAQVATLFVDWTDPLKLSQVL